MVRNAIFLFYNQYQGRKPQYQIHPMILARRSLKIMTGEEMTDEEIMPLLEAARWGPSNFNNQPWRFVYAKRKTTHFPKLLDLLHPKNQLWAKDASILMFMLTNKYNNYKGNKTLLVTNAFATGAVRNIFLFEP
jgi:nitroreductase